MSVRVVLGGGRHLLADLVFVDVGFVQLEVSVPLRVERDVRRGRAGLLQVVGEVGADEADRGGGVDEPPADLVEVAHVVDEHVLLEVREELLDVHGLDGRRDRHV